MPGEEGQAVAEEMLRRRRTRRLLPLGHADADRIEPILQRGVERIPSVRAQQALRIHGGAGLREACRETVPHLAVGPHARRRVALAQGMHAREVVVGEEVRLAAELEQGPGEQLGPQLSPAVVETRRPLPVAMPKLEIDGLEEVCCHIKRIEGLVVRQKIRRDGVLLEREAQGIYTSPLVLTLPEPKGQGFRRWLEACEAGKSNGRTATLLLGSPAVGFTVALHGVRPVRIDDLAADDSDDPRRRDLRVELKARDIAFALAPGK